MNTKHSPTGPTAAGASTDDHGSVHFGGTAGALVMILVIPLVTFYLWAAIFQHGGSLWLPSSLSEFFGMFPAPTLKAVGIVAGWFAVQAIFYMYLPGRVVDGRPAEASGEQAEYRLNGLLAFGLTAVLLVGAIAAGLFSPSGVLLQLGPMLTIAVVLSIALSAWTYISGRRRGALERSTGEPIADFFMGTILNPKFGRHDLKFFLESRVGMGCWGALAIIMPAAQLEVTGTISTAMWVVSVCQMIYIVDFFVFEDNLLSMMDIIEENLGFMLMAGFIVWMPFNFTLQQQYILVENPSLSVGASIALIALNMAGYYLFRSTNLQKKKFREDPTRKIWGKPAEYMDTERGTKLLLSGWWGKARHTNYLGDLMMALAWCMACGFGSVVPYFYFIYFLPLLLNRERRDNDMCKRKYGADWDRYCEKVPYRIVPYVY